MMCGGGRRLLTSGLGLLFVLLSVRLACPDDTTQPVDAQLTEQIRQWVADLDSDLFAQRKSATSGLIEAGIPAIDPIVNSLIKGPRETVARGMYILEELAQSKHRSVAETARTAVEQLAAGSEDLIVRRARTSLQKLNEIRRERAKLALQNLGAEIHMQTLLIEGELVSRPYLLRIDETWLGIDDDLVHIEALDGLKLVTLEGRQIKDVWLEHLPALKSVETVSLVHVDINDHALEQLTEMPSLQRLAVMYSPITDAATESLLKLRQVRQFKLYGTRISPRGGENLKSRIGWAEVDIKNGAFLGISPARNDSPVIIATVQSGSAAQRAGLVVNDQITHYAGHTITDFEFLRDLIGNNHPGDEVDVRVTRGTENLTIRVKLGEWDSRRLPF